MIFWKGRKIEGERKKRKKEEERREVNQSVSQPARERERENRVCLFCLSLGRSIAT